MKKVSFESGRPSWLAEVLVFILFLLFIAPFIIVVINSAKETFEITNSPLSLPQKWSHIFVNMRAILANPSIRYTASLGSSLLITIGSLLFIAFSSSMAAWILVRTPSRLSGIVFMFFVAGMVIPFQVVMFPLISLFRSINTFIGLRMLRTYHGMIFAYVGFGAPLSVFMFHGFIKSVPLELEESATISGCTKVETFALIVFPILKPIFVTILILNGIWIWNDFLLPSLILGIGNSIQTLPLAVQGFAGSFVKKWDLILTATLMAMIPIIVAFLFAQRYIIKGMVEGSIK